MSYVLHKSEGAGAHFSSIIRYNKTNSACSLWDNALIGTAAVK